MQRKRELSSMKDKRIEWIDVAKAIGIIIVLAYHACPDGYFKNMMWQMHMPLFAFLSGIVYKEEYSLNFQKVRIFIVKKIEKLYIPFEAYSLFFLLLHNFFYKINFIGEINGNKILSGGGYVKQFVLILTLGGGESLTGALWYLIPLFELEIIFTVLLCLFKQIKKDKECNCVVAVIVAFIYILFSNLNLPRNLSNASRLILFYSAGYFCKKYNVLELKRSVPKQVAALVGCLAIWIGCTLYSESWQGKNLLITAVSAGAAIYCVVEISKFLTKVAKEQVVAILKYIGKKTMPIVAWHFLVYCFVKMAYVWCYNLDRTLVATKEAICDPKWIAIYVVCGLIGSLLIDEIVSEIKGYVLKIGGKFLYGGIK